MTLAIKESRAIRNEITDLRIKNMYKPKVEVEAKITLLLEKLYPIELHMVSKSPHYTTTCGKAYPMAYWDNLVFLVCSMLFLTTTRGE